MILSTDQVLQRIKAPKNKSFIDLASYQEERLYLHAESVLEKYNLPFQSFRNFTSWWQSLISSVKYNRIDELLNCPLFTVGIVKDIFDQLRKFIEAQDRYISFNFTEQDFTNDYNAFLQSQNDDTFWKGKIIEELKTGICSYIVIDLPSKQITERPEPYSYFVAPRTIIDVELNKFNGKTEFIIFTQSDFYWDAKISVGAPESLLNTISNDQVMNKMIAIDDKSYKVFVKQKNKADWLLMSESPHGLGYCPVIDFWRDSIKGTNGLNKCGPITLQLGNLDYVLFFKACIDYMNLYGPFPLLVKYEEVGMQYDDKSKEFNIGNNYDYSKNNPVSNVLPLQDPRVASRDTMAPGGGYTVPSPADSTDHDFMKNPIKFIGMDTNAIKFANELLDKFEDDIFKKCTGIDIEYMNEIAKNAEMLAASFSKEETILDWIKGNMERVHKFVTDAKCQLRYGTSYYKGCTIAYGSDRLLKSAETLVTELKTAQDSGMPTLYCEEIAKTAILTRFKNNPEKLARMRIFCDLEPYPTWSVEDLIASEIYTCDQENFIIKANFSSFVSRFELEAGNIVTFGSLIPYSQKISIIKQKFIEYAGSIKWTPPTTGIVGDKKRSNKKAVAQ